MSELLPDAAPTDAKADLAAEGARTLVVVVTGLSIDEGERRLEDRIEEARGLAEAIGLNVVDVVEAPLRKPDPARLIGGGKVGELHDRVEEEDIALISIDADLSPVQQRNLERAIGAKVLDRTGLILEIFGARARTKEGRLQTELAHLRFQRSRLVRSWTHLERQRGGAGFMGGPGETQIEADRRMLADKIRRLEAKLRDVRRTRDVQRAGRETTERPTMALVGYTNAGKSTLFNRLADATVSAKDQVFQTLDPTLRVARSPGGIDVILGDTVGFVADLPTLLVEAFKATLEETASADVLIHVRDVSSPDTEAQCEDVKRVLEDLGVDAADPRPVIEVWNKMDRLDDDERADRMADARRRNVAIARPTLDQPWVVPVSAAKGEGIGPLWAAIETVARLDHVTVEIESDATQARLEPWLRRHGGVESVRYDDGAILVRASLSEANLGRLRKEFASAVIRPVSDGRRDCG